MQYIPVTLIYAPSFQQVFISIQALVLVADPYFVSYVTCYVYDISIYLSNAVTYYTRV